jgi:hypothetical protein
MDVKCCGGECGSCKPSYKIQIWECLFVCPLVLVEGGFCGGGH